MSTELIPFDFKGRLVRVVSDTQDEPWFVAADVAQSIEYRMASNMTRSLDDDEKGTQIVRTHLGNKERCWSSTSPAFTRRSSRAARLSP